MGEVSRGGIDPHGRATSRTSHLCVCLRPGWLSVGGRGARPGGEGVPSLPGSTSLATPGEEAPDQPAAFAAHGVHARERAAGAELVDLGGIHASDEGPCEGARGLSANALGEEGLEGRLRLADG